MTRKLLTLAATLVLSSAAFAESSFERTLSTSAQPDLYLSTGSGNVRIFAGSGDAIHIKGRVHAGWGSSGETDGRITRIAQNPPISQSGNTVRVGDTKDRQLFNNITIDYEVTVPADVALNLRSGSGDVEVDHVARFLAATSGSGSVRAHGIHGPADLSSGSGDIEVEEEAPGDIKARTGSGSIRVHGLNGAFNARTGSGDIEADGRLPGPANLSSGSGAIRLHLSPDTRFNLEASTGSGDIRVSLPGAPSHEDRNRHHLTASINGGGPALEVRTGSGDIDITPH